LKINIPGMVIESNAINLGFAGSHTFTNEVDYHFRVLLNELLSAKAKKSKKENNEFGVEEDDGLGRTNLYVGMKGPLENPRIYYDSESLKKQFRENLASEKKDVKALLKEEFGWFKKDSTLRRQTVVKQEVGVDFSEEPGEKKDPKKQTTGKPAKVKKATKKHESEYGTETSDDFN
jgi:hypothetical protein